eukprot:TRINITY_DN609_c3_g1_i1.p2 TRINITY_DN609_c3_g1~~TRINITY_DN609_c3_g1_i1.p2  ORF type:complete len:55 (+),score=4.55 TRINITY_DN609_c3_g1_i1:140-304(+)
MTTHPIEQNPDCVCVVAKSCNGDVLVIHVNAIKYVIIGSVIINPVKKKNFLITY